MKNENIALDSRMEVLMTNIGFLSIIRLKMYYQEVVVRNIYKEKGTDRIYQKSVLYLN